MNRIQELDALRGTALFGVLLVNIFVFHAPISYYGIFYGAFEGLQAVTVNLVVDYAAGKFLFIFAFLFGFGIILQAHSRAEAAVPYLTRRMLVLFLFGAMHILLFWFGDILASYGLLGLLVIPTIRWSKQSILALASFFIFFRPLYYLGAVAFSWPMLSLEQPAELEEFISVFSEGNYLEIFEMRMIEFVAFLPENLVWYMPKTLGVLFLGMYAARQSLFTRIREHKTSFLFAALLMIGLSAGWNFVKMDVFSQIDLKATPYWRPALMAINVLCETALSCGYILGFSILFQTLPNIARILAIVGRFALSNYILQSVICVLIFFGYGFGYYGKLRPTDLMLLSLVIFGFNLLISFVYSKYRRMGPLEQLWRRLIR